MPKKHVVRPGECIASISYEHGFFHERVWNDPANADLRALRKNPYTLLEGDEVSIPDLEPKSVRCSTGQKHVFRRRGVPERLVIRILDCFGNPRIGLGYEIEIAGEKRQGATGEDGRLREWIPPNAMSARLTLATGEVYNLALGRLAPLDTLLGVQQRLGNLGYSCGSDPPGQIGPGTDLALRRYCEARGLEVPPAWDEAGLSGVRRDLAGGSGG